MALPAHVVAIARAQRDAPGQRDASGRLRPGHRVRRRAPRVAYPHAIEAAYAKALVDVVGRIRQAIAPALTKLRELTDRSRSDRADAADRFDVGTAADMARAIDAARAALSAAVDSSSLRRIAVQHADSTDAFAKAQFQKQSRAAIGVDVRTLDKRVPDLIDHFASENVQLIRSLGNKTLDDVAKIASRGLSDGTSYDDMAEDIGERYGISERHARLIARDQVGKLNGRLAATRQQELGITRFVWRTAGDERVRDEHRELDGKTFAYDDPPAEGIPGEPVCCRCTAEPVMDDVIGEVDSDVDAAAPDIDAAASGGGSSGGGGDGDGGDGDGGDRPKKNPKRVEAAKKAGEASAERSREIHSAVKSNLPAELHVAWEKEGHKFLRQEAGRIKGVKDRINAASKISEAFAEQYGSGGETVFGNEGDRYFKRAEIEARHAEKWADDQERGYYDEMQREAMKAGDIDENGELTEQGRRRREVESAPSTIGAGSNTNDEDPPF